MQNTLYKEARLSDVFELKVTTRLNYGFRGLAMTSMKISYFVATLHDDDA